MRNDLYEARRKMYTTILEDYEKEGLVATSPKKVIMSGERMMLNQNNKGHTNHPDLPMRIEH